MAERLAPAYPPFEKIARHFLITVILGTILLFQATIANELGVIDGGLRDLGNMAAYSLILYAFLPWFEFVALIALEKIRAFEERRGWVEE